MEFEVNLPIDEVIAKYDNEENLKHWMRGLQSFETFEGTPGQPGAKATIKFDTGKRKMEMTETILTKNLPSDFSMTYDAPGVHNIVKNEFVDLGDKTKWIQHQEFQFKSFGMKLMSKLMGGAFKKQSMQYANNFKAFAEEGKSVLD